MLVSRLRTRPPEPSARPRALLPFIGAALACGAALGAGLEYFLDPRAGRRRRHSVRDRAKSRVRRGGRRAVVRARRTESHAVGIAKRTVNGRLKRREPVDDVTLAHKVESELYRRAGLPKGHISINAEDGVVFLRGVLDRQEDIARIAAATRAIRGVRAVENLMHMPGTPAPASRPRLQREPVGTLELNGERAVGHERQ